MLIKATVLVVLFSSWSAVPFQTYYTRKNTALMDPLDCMADHAIMPVADHEQSYKLQHTKF